MPTLTISISEELLEDVKSRAKTYGRSVQDEVILCLYDATVGKPMRRELTPKEIKQEIRRYQANMPTVHIDNDELNRYKREGRL